jgi:hypothetical protein
MLYSDIVTYSEACAVTYGEDDACPQADAIAHMPVCTAARNDLDPTLCGQSFPHVPANRAKPQLQP